MDRKKKCQFYKFHRTWANVFRKTRINVRDFVSEPNRVCFSRWEILQQPGAFSTEHGYMFSFQPWCIVPLGFQRKRNIALHSTHANNTPSVYSHLFFQVLCKMARARSQVQSQWFQRPHGFRLKSNTGKFQQINSSIAVPLIQFDSNTYPCRQQISKHMQLIDRSESGMIPKFRTELFRSAIVMNLKTLCQSGNTCDLQMPPLEFIDMTNAFCILQ